MGLGCLSKAERGSELSVRQGCRLSRKHKGANVNVSETGLGASGSGSVLCSAPILQSKCQFEVKVVKKGAGISLGLVGLVEGLDVDKTLTYQPNTWMLDVAEGKVVFGDEESVVLEQHVDPAIGDVLGCTFDQDNAMISFYLNGTQLAFSSPLTMPKLRGSIHPAISLTEPAEVEATFETSDFAYSCEDKGYVGIMIARSLI